MSFIKRNFLCKYKSIWNDRQYVKTFPGILGSDRKSIIPLGSGDKLQKTIYHPQRKIWIIHENAVSAIYISPRKEMP